MSTMDEPLVSVLMAVKDAELYLAQALDSVAAQTCQDYEIIIVDGGSSDADRRIAKRYSRVNWIAQNASGLAHAWNMAIDAARAPFIAFLDSDDTWSPTKLTDQLDYFSRHAAADCVVGRAKFFLEPGHPMPAAFNPVLLEGDYVAHMPGTAMIRRSVFERMGKFNEEWPVASDIAWFAKLRETNTVIGILDDVVLHKRVHSTNLSLVTPWPVYQRELTQLLKQAIDRRRDLLRQR